MKYKSLTAAITYVFCLCGLNAQTNVSVAKYHGNCKAAVSYTFDDGLLEHYTKVFPEFKKRNIKGSFCIIGSKVGHDMKGTPCMNWEQLREMADDGQEITNHGWAHRNVTNLTADELRYEVQHNDTAIYNNVGVFPRTYFYPGNRKTDTAVEFCSQDRTGTRTFQISIGSKRDTEWLKKWIDGIISHGEWGIGMTHGITTGYDAFTDPSILWNHIDYACSRRDSLWIAPLHDVSAYIQERDNIKLKVRTKGNITEIAMQTGLDPKIFNVPLTMTVCGNSNEDTPGNIVASQDGVKLNIYRKERDLMFDFNPNGGKITIIHQYNLK
ncbi:polysaccharide deacetylase family protein [Xylanibacter muris]|uniref:Polysaccharide deacetylase family protein n=1 Tax=Xylanibacter muris TaxID=2736290 RepID=A0ABX2AMD6_9BACT|nr:polysaccharide deacetylase family protein [Xylanibacter muris]NPD91106.1 polysaccharide deacetylase family protein [Xylanibacter muris]